MPSRSMLHRTKTNASEAVASERIIRVGVTGHRPHRLKLSDDVLRRRIASVIAALRHGGRNAPANDVEIVSALAEGADVIVAQAGVELGCRLTAVLPFKPKDYESTFSAKQHKTVFRRLFAKANDRVVLPGSLRRATAGYVDVGLETLARSDIVLTIWDGAPAQGSGGTPEILQSALDRRIPIVWIHAVKNGPPRLLRRAAFGPAPALIRFASSAKRLRKSELQGLPDTAADAKTAGHKSRESNGAQGRN